MIAYFDVPQILWGASNCNGAMMGFNLQDTRAMTRVTRPVSCALCPGLLLSSCAHISPGHPCRFAHADAKSS